MQLLPGAGLMCAMCVIAACDESQVPRVDAKPTPTTDGAAAPQDPVCVSTGDLPVELAPARTAGTRCFFFTALLTNFDARGRSLVVDSENVYWNSGDSINKVPVTGGSPVSIASTTCEGPIAVAGATLYWGDKDIRSVSIQGGDDVILAPMAMPSLAWDIATDGASVYWTNAPDGLMKVPQDGRSIPTLVTTDAVSAMVVSEGNAYFASGSPIPAGRVSKISFAGGGPVVLADTGAGVLALAVHRGYVYWVANEVDSFCSGGSWCFFPDRSVHSGSVARVATTGGPVETWATGVQPALAIAVDDSGVYWLGLDRIMRTSSDGTTSAMLACNQNLPRHIALDATNVYWMNADGSIMTVRK